ncbi:type II toxin-antitoxin system ParD family antitoxin [Amphibiibacter pelophylacis]|uniref:Type II toxin-antitoxin system ParD family antitoxin n=1 Tax=Amphibiibacter pelophylacis TaxID=1799477 RepID=A0ACC6P4Y3_9BURK
MSLHLNLSPEMEGFVREKVRTGFYGNATEVIRDALRRMQAEDARLTAWRAAIQAGDNELDRGEGIAWTPRLMDDLTRIALDATQQGRPMDPDVLP